MVPDTQRVAATRKMLSALCGSETMQQAYCSVLHENYFELTIRSFLEVTESLSFSRNPKIFGLSKEESLLVAEFCKNDYWEAEKIVAEFVVTLERKNSMYELDTTLLETLNAMDS